MTTGTFFVLLKKQNLFLIYFTYSIYFKVFLKCFETTKTPKWLTVKTIKQGPLFC